MTTPQLDNRLPNEAEQHLRQHLDVSVLNHSQRVRHLATTMAAPELDLTALAVAALFHDAGTADPYNGPDRFEVEGAHAAARFLQAHDWTPQRIQPVWAAIALHTFAGIAENAGQLPRLIRTAVLVDFGAISAPADAITRSIEAEYPRGTIERTLGDLLVAQATTAADPLRKAPPNSWPAALVAGADRIDPHGINPNF